MGCHAKVVAAQVMLQGDPSLGLGCRSPRATVFAVNSSWPETFDVMWFSCFSRENFQTAYCDLRRLTGTPPGTSLEHVD